MVDDNSTQSGPVRTIVLASGNPGKLAELQALLGPTGISTLAQREFAVPEVAETGLSFIENAIIKARHACQHSGLPALADDSGLVVDALGGEPGIYSARYSGSQATDTSNNDKLLRKLAGLPMTQRRARFVCAIALLRHQHDPCPIICQGSWQGHILDAPQGDRGFGYDPLFFIEQQQCSSAQLDPALKNRISHRARAMRCLAEQLSGSAAER